MSLERRTLVIANPQARHGEAAKLLPVIGQLLSALPHDFVETTRPSHAVEVASASSHYDLVVAAGGDGTVHEVLNGLMSIPAEQRPALGVLPTGSGNDTRRTLGVPEDLTQAALALVSGERIRFDIGRCNGVYFNNSFAAGLDAKVTAKSVELKVTKQRDGLWLYLSALFHVLFRELESFDLDIRFDDGASQALDTLIVAATIGPTYGGGFRITPDADPHDGLLEVCMIDPLSLPQALLRLPFVILGRHTRMRPVHMSRRRSLVIESDVALPAQIDGEVLLAHRYDVELVPDAIECVVPRRLR